MNFTIGIGPNLRQSPYFEATLADGVQSFSVYNHMLIPAHFGKPEREYQRLIEGVVMWDVGAQRQVEIGGRDAGKLVQYLCTRDIRDTQVGQGRYVPICNHQGLLINDPVLLKLEEDRFWLSIADSDIELWASAIAQERGLQVQVKEADASPMAVQGPKAEDLIASIFGDWVRDLKYFWFKSTHLQGIPVVLARSGWSKQGGFELYLQDSTRGSELWQLVKQAGGSFDIGPGAPNDVERLESGLLSYGADARLQVNPANPFELGLGKLVDLDNNLDFVGKQALLEIRNSGIKRELCGFFIEGDAVSPCGQPLPVLSDGETVGYLSELAYSSRLERNIAIGVVSIQFSQNENLNLIIDGEPRRLSPGRLPFIAGSGGQASLNKCPN